MALTPLTSYIWGMRPDCNMAGRMISLAMFARKLIKRKQIHALAHTHTHTLALLLALTHTTLRTPHASPHTPQTHTPPHTHTHTHTHTHRQSISETHSGGRHLISSNSI